VLPPPRGGEGGAGLVHRARELARQGGQLGDGLVPLGADNGGGDCGRWADESGCVDVREKGLRLGV